MTSDDLAHALVQTYARGCRCRRDAWCDLHRDVLTPRVRATRGPAVRPPKPAVDADVREQLEAL